MEQYLPVFVLFVLAVLFAAVSFFASRIVSPKNPNPDKFGPYECGIVPGRDNPERFPVKFYLVAMLFVIFDIEIIFLYPWAVDSQALGAGGYIAILIFSALVFESFIYLLSKGALDWGPLQISKRQDGLRSQARTSDSTIRRVGLEGRLEQAESLVSAAASSSDQES